MTTAAVTLTESYQLIATGPVVVQFATSYSDGNPAIGAKIASDAEEGFARLHVGTVLPADDSFAYMEAPEVVEYYGTESVYMRAHKGTRVVKVTPIV